MTGDFLISRGGPIDIAVCCNVCLAVIPIVVNPVAFQIVTTDVKCKCGNTAQVDVDCTPIHKPSGEVN